MLTLRVPAALFLLSVPVLAGCGGTPGEETGQTASAANAGATMPAITFSADFTQTVSGPLFAGQALTIAYDPARMVAQCGGSATSGGGSGGFAWQITGYYSIGSATPTSFPVTITGAWATGDALITPATAGTLEVWFGCGNTSGNTGWDSNYGKNYDLQVGQKQRTSGKVVVQVLSDAVDGNAGSVPPDTLASTPTEGALIYDGPWEAGNPLGQTLVLGDQRLPAVANALEDQRPAQQLELARVEQQRNVTVGGQRRRQELEVRTPG